MKNADFPFDLGLRAKSGQDDFTVCAYTSRGRDTVDDICGARIEWFEQSGMWLARLTPAASMVPLATEALKRDLLVGQISPDYKTTTRYDLGADGIAFVSN
jgi:hypothetical protein